jgi:hypothetical protein
MSTVTTQHAHAPSGVRPGRFAITALMIIGPLMGVVNAFLITYNGDPQAAGSVARVYAHQGKFTGYVWTEVAFAIVYAPALLAIAVRGAAGARRLGGYALGILLTAFFAMAMVMSVDTTMLAASHAGLDEATTVKLIDKGFDLPVFAVPLIWGLLGQLVGLILLGLALRRGKAGPAWTGWTIITSVPLLVVGSIVGVPPLVAVGYLLQATAATGIGATVLREGIGWIHTPDNTLATPQPSAT